MSAGAVTTKSHVDQVGNDEFLMFLMDGSGPRGFFGERETPFGRKGRKNARDMCWEDEPLRSVIGGMSSKSSPEKRMRIGVVVATMFWLSFFLPRIEAMHANFSCYVCDQDTDPSCCGGPRRLLHPTQVLLFGVEDFIPTCVTRRTNEKITARYAEELPLTKWRLAEGCEAYPGTDDVVQVCYCTGTNCNDEVDCNEATTTVAPTSENNSDTTLDTATPTTSTQTPFGRCPAKKGVRIGGKKYDLQQTPSGGTFQTTCETRFPETGGHALWKCDLEGRWELDTPDFSGCWTINYKLFMDRLEESSDDEEAIPKIVHDLKNALDIGLEETVGGDLIRAVEFTSAVLPKWEDLDPDLMPAEEFLDEFMAVSDLLGSMATAWRTCGPGAPEIMVSLLGQPFAAAFIGAGSAEDLAEEPRIYDKDTMRMVISAIKLPTSPGARIASEDFAYLNSHLSLYLGFQSGGDPQADSTPLRMAAMGYKSMHEHFGVASTSKKAGLNARRSRDQIPVSVTGFPESRMADWTPNSRVFGAQMHPEDFDRVPSGSHHVFQADNLCPVQSEAFAGRRPVCLGLISGAASARNDTNQTAAAEWSDRFCTVDPSDESVTRCRCLLDVSMMITALPREPGDEELCRNGGGDTDTLFLDVVLPGLAIGAACFIVCLGVFIFKRPRVLGPLFLTRTNFAVASLVLCLASIGAVKMDPVGDPKGCRSFGGLSVFGLFSVLSWLACDALCVKQLISGSKRTGIITGRRKLRRIVLPLVCYGLPALFILLTVISTKWNDFSHPDYCYLNLDTSSVWAFVVYALSAYAVAFSALISALLKLQKARSWDCGMSEFGAGGDDAEPDSFTAKKSLFECLIFAIFSLSSSICVVVYYSQASEAAAVGLTVFSAFQGIFALIAFVTSAFRKSIGSGGLHMMNGHRPFSSRGGRDHHMMSDFGGHAISSADAAAAIAGLDAGDGNRSSVRHRQNQPQRGRRNRGSSGSGGIEAESVI